MPAAWKTVRVFLSSTFRDMHAERDHLVKVTFPQLRQWCAERRLHLVDIDLRWGVTKEQADNGRAIDVCLQEINGSRPFFVCILGERYGWVPERLPPEEVYTFQGLQAATHLSITHLEIIHATEQSLARAAGSRRPACSQAFFYFRRPESLPAPETLLGEFRDEYQKTFFEELPRRREQLARLKREIRDRYQAADRVCDYTGLWDAEADNPEDDRLRGRLTRLDEFGARVESDLKRGIELQFAEHLAGLDRRDPLAEERSLHEAFVENRTRVHVPRTAVEERLTRYVEAEDLRPLIVLAPPGSGKSALLAHWTKHHATLGQTTVVARFIGASPASTSLHRLLDNLCRELTHLFGLTEEVEVESASGQRTTQRQPMTVPDDPVRLREKWPHFLEEAGRKGRLVLVLDALNQLDRSADPRHLDWLPTRLPANVRLIVSVLDHGESPALPGRLDWLTALRQRRFLELRVPPLDEEERRRILRELPSVFCKTLDDEQVTLLLQNEATRNPLFLTVSLEELRIFGSFEKLPDAIAALPDLDDPDVDGDIDRALDRLFGQVLERLDRETSRRAPGMVAALFGMLAVAREGLSEQEIGELLARKLPMLPERERQGTLQIILRQVRPYVMRKGTAAGALVDFYHRSFQKAVAHRHLTGSRERRAFHSDLAGYFAEQPYYRTANDQRPRPNLRKLVELPTQLRAAASATADLDPEERRRAWEPLERLLADLPFLEAKAEAGMAFELVGDFTDALTRLPETSAQRPLLRLLEEALRSDIHFIAQHPEMVFQCLWNRGWSHGNPASAAHHEPAEGRPSDSDGHLSVLLREWKNSPSRSSAGRPWLRSLRPPEEPLAAARQGVLRGHGNVVFSVALSADGQRIASASWDETIRIWDAVSGQELACLRGHEGAVEAVAFSPDGTGLVSGASDSTARLWDVSGQPGPCLRGHQGWVMGVAFAPDGRHVATASWDATVRVWEADSGQQTACLQHDAGLFGVAFLPNGRLVCGDKVGVLHVWDWTSGREVQRLIGHEAEVRGIAPFADGRHLASSSRDRTVRIWDLGRGTEQACLRGHTGTVYSVAVSADGRRIASSSWDRTVRIWDADTGSTVSVLRGHTEDVSTVALSADGRRVVSGSWDWTVSLWDVEQAVAVPLLRNHKDTISSAAFSPDGRLLASGAFDRAVHLWDAASGILKHELRGHEGMVSSLAFTPDGRRLASGSFDETIRIWDTVQGREIACLRGHTRPVLSVAFSESGRQVCSGSFDGSVRVWDVAASAEATCCTGHTGRVGAVAFSHEGDRIVSGSKDRTVRVWDARTGAQLACLQGHARDILAVGFLAGDRRVYSVSRDRTMRVWELENGACVETISEGWQPWMTPQGGPWRALRRGTDLAITDSEREPVAWLPLAPHLLALHPSGRTWAVPVRSHLHLFTLENV